MRRWFAFGGVVFLSVFLLLVILSTLSVPSQASGVELQPLPPHQVVLEAVPAALPVDGISTAILTATVTDVYSQPVTEGTIVTFTTSLGLLSSSPGGTMGTVFLPLGTSADGVVTALLTAGLEPGWAIVTATAGGQIGTVRVQFGSFLYLPIVMREYDPGSVPPPGYCLDISFEYGTNTLPFDRGHDVDVSVFDCDTSDPYLNLVVSFSTDAGAFDYSGVQDPINQYAEATTNASGVASQTVYANEPVTATLRAWVDLDGDDTWDSGEPYDVATKVWFVPENEPYLLASTYEVLPEEWITVDVFNHPVADEPFTLLWCQISGAGIASSVLTTSIDVDTDGNALDLPVMIPIDSAGVYQLETHTEPPGGCGAGTRVAYSAEIRIQSPPSDLTIISISYSDVYSDVLPANEIIPFRIAVENLSPWNVEGGPFDVDLYVNPPVTPSLGQVGDGKQWLAGIDAYGTEVVTVELDIGPGIHELWAQVDTTDYVQEQDEANNVFGPYEIEVDCTASSSDYGDDFNDGVLDNKWLTAEIVGAGSVVSGSVTESGDGALQIHGLGSEIWGSSDNFFYVYQSISGDFDVRLRVISPPPNSGSKLGIMVRNSVAADSRHVMVAARDADGRRLQFVYRENDGADTVYAGSELDPAPSPPVWLRIVRSGDDFAYYYAYAGNPTSGDWTLHDTGATVSMDDTVLVGIAHAKYSSSGAPYTSQVDEFVVCQASLPEPTPIPPGLAECTQLCDAGDFEGNLDDVFPPWQAGDSPGAWQRDGYFPHWGAFSVHLHASQATWPCDTTPPYDPWLAQTVEIPTNIYTMTSITVEGYRAVGGSRSECSVYGSTDVDDALYVELLDAVGNPLTTPPPGLIVDGGVVTDTWQHFSVDFAGIDLQPYAGQDVRVRFYTIHDGDRYGTYFYLDDLECNLCTEWPIPEGEPGTASIGGRVQVLVGGILRDMPGVTVVAYSQGGEVYRTLSIHDTTYHFYNIPPGDYTVYAEAWVYGRLLVDSDTVTVAVDERNYGVNLMLQ